MTSWCSVPSRCSSSTTLPAASDVDTAASVVGGIAKGCELAGCALIGGETAEMPGMYPAGEYDSAGFAVGVVEKSKAIDGKSIQPGDVVLGRPLPALIQRLLAGAQDHRALQPRT